MRLVGAGVDARRRCAGHRRRDAPRARVDERIGGAGLALTYVGIGLLLVVHRAARPGHGAGAVGQHVRVHQPDLLLGSGRRRGRAAPPAVPRAVGLRAGSGADPADGVGPLALHQRRAGHARPAVLLAADPRVGGQPRLGGVPGRRRGQHPVPAQDVAAGRSRTARARWPASSQRLPDAQTLDRIAYRTTIFAFPVFGFGVIFGAIWAEEAWGRYWGWDPKETVSFIAWVIYAAYLHARSTAGWRDSKAAWINVAGFVAMVFNLFFINLVTVGSAFVRRSRLRGTSACLTIPRTALRIVSARTSKRMPFRAQHSGSTGFRGQNRFIDPAVDVPPEWTAPTPPNGLPLTPTPLTPHRRPIRRDRRPAAVPGPVDRGAARPAQARAVGGLAQMAVSGVVQTDQRRRKPEGHPPQHPDRAGAAAAAGLLPDRAAVAEGRSRQDDDHRDARRDVRLDPR